MRQNKKIFNYFKIKKNILFSTIFFFLFTISLLIVSCSISTISYSYSLDKISYEMCNYNAFRYPEAEQKGALLQVYPKWNENDFNSLDYKHKELCLSLQNSSMIKSVVTVSDSTSNVAFVSLDDSLYDFSEMPKMISFYDYSGYREQREPQAYKTNGVSYYTFFPPLTYYDKHKYYDFCIISESMAQELCDKGFAKSFEELLYKTIEIRIRDVAYKIIINNIGFDSLRTKGYYFKDLNFDLVSQYGKNYLLTYAMSDNSSLHPEIEYHIDVLTNYSAFSVYNCLERIKSTYADSSTYSFYAKDDNGYKKNEFATNEFNKALSNRTSNTINFITIPLLILDLIFFIFLLRKKLISEFYLLLFSISIILVISVISSFLYFFYMWSILGLTYLIILCFCFLVWRFKNGLFIKKNRSID